MRKYDFDTIYDGIKQGKIDTLMVVTTQVNEDDEWTDLISCAHAFAGTTIEECKRTMNWLVKNTEAAEYTQVSYFAQQLHVEPNSLREAEECDDKGEIIMDYIYSHLDELDNVGTSDWNNQVVEYKYESMEDGILLYWSWQKYIGYARKAINLEYCIMPETTRLCKPVDKVFATQCTFLLSSDDIMSCSDKEELIMLLQQKIDDMGKWQNNINVEDFIEDLYKKTEDTYSSFKPSYKLPGL